jgi:uncharacterized membrane protein (DUF2068 family)
MGQDAGMDPARRDTGIRLILAFKLGKAALWLTLATVLGLLVSTGRLEPFRAMADELQTHVASRWSLLLGRALVSALSAKGLRFIEIGLALDGVISAVEAWALWRGHRWAPWLVAVASALPVPFELWELVRRPSPWRALLLVVNLAVVTYLAWWLRRYRTCAASHSR